MNDIIVHLQYECGALGFGTLLKGRCILRRCGVEGPAGDACDGCPSNREAAPQHRGAVLPGSLQKRLSKKHIARDCGVDAKTVREYFQILVDILLGVFVEPFSRRRSRSVITRTPRFYLFDVGVAGYLMGRRIERPTGPEFGRALKHFVLMELLAYRSYREQDYPIRFWRTKTGLECDFVLGREGEVAVEVKGKTNVQSRDLTGLRAYREEHKPRHAVLVANETALRRTSDGLWMLPWREFLERLWAGDLV